MKNRIKQLLPPAVRGVLRQVSQRVAHSTHQLLRVSGMPAAGYRIRDHWEERLGRRDPLTPPRRLIFVGDGDFRIIGERFLRYLIELAALQPHHRVLDIGCGIGRIAVPLTRYLGPRGSYEGIDIVPAGIDWCTRRITPRYPQFRFQVADIANQAYNPTGRQRASAFHFPYPDGAFDLVLLTSVFTHMLPEELEHYLQEISRLLTPAGRCLVTAFLLNAESQQLIQAGKSILSFGHARGSYAVEQADLPEAAVAYQETYLRRQVENAGLRLVEPIHYGSWCGRARFLDGQDLIIAAKR